MMLYQKSIAELEAQPDCSVIEQYTPTPEDRARGKVIVFTERRLEDGSPDWESTVHMLPTFGLPHLIHCACWCGPEIYRDPDYYFHRSSQ
jgi:hypothetical protein